LSGIQDFTQSASELTTVASEGKIDEAKLRRTTRPHPVYETEADEGRDVFLPIRRHLPNISDLQHGIQLDEEAVAAKCVQNQYNTGVVQCAAKLQSVDLVGPYNAIAKMPATFGSQTVKRAGDLFARTELMNAHGRQLFDVK